MISAFLLILLPAQALQAQQFMTLGGRAAGMGGAYVAVADDPSATYWNPAAAALIPRSWAGGYGGVHYADYGGLVDLVNDIADFDPGGGDGMDPETLEEALDILERLEAEGLRANGEGNWGFGLGSNGFAFSLMELYYATVFPVADLPDPGQVTDWEEELENNTSNLSFRGLRLREYVVTTSRRLGKTLYVGSNLKYVQGRTYASEIDVFDDWSGTSLRDLVDETFNGEQEKDNAFSFDIGVLALPVRNLRIGLVCRDITTPSFRFAGERGKIKLTRQWRAGFAFGPPHSYTLAMDLDLSENNFSNENPVANRKLAIGFEKKLFRSAMAVRGGYNRNIGDGENLNTFTAGLGAALGGLHMEFGGAFAREKKSFGLSGTAYYIF
jgi:hypothetical protein